ncbi:glycerophosphodiester phosphodiesterase [Latilactobacillus sakei]|uniref:glycerophosphodiester phosphodiesterase n=1 Tax=Latilactobacillus sakei TaxID=1599 RepID=UPI0004FFE0FD|nr:glycerophosphodiester phosphodiesterase [Latilactobacillus sakei]
MRRLFRFLKANFQAFGRHWSVYVLLVVSINFVLTSLIVPGLTWGVNRLLVVNGIGYLTYTNFVSVLTKHPLVLISLVLLVLLICGLVYIQMAFLFRQIKRIQEQTPASQWQLLKQSGHDLLTLKPLTMLIMIGYFLLILPFGQIIFKSVLLNKVTIPAFIIQDMWTTPKIWGPIILVYTLALILSIRLITFLPETIFNKKLSTTRLLQKCWQMTRGRFWRLLIKVGVLATAITLVGVLSQLLLFNLQRYYDQNLLHYALLLAILNLFILEIISQILLAMSIVMILQLILKQAGYLVPSETRVKVILKHRSLRIRMRQGAAMLLLILVAAGVDLYDYAYLEGAMDNRPALISHRGVDDGNGVQNTIPALQKTAREKPDYIEMDIQETKDHQFVVMHDNNLEELAGVNRTVHELTLAELTALTVRENGYSAKIPSFDQYLTAAEKAHQRLLVEIKVSPQDSPQMMTNFIKRYQQRLLKNGDRIHSLSYPVVAALKKQAPHLFVSFILPYNISFPETPANAYTMEATTLKAAFINQAHAGNQAVYAWTVNDPDVMQRLLLTEVDGIITDNLSDLKDVVAENNDHPSYATRLLIYSSQLAGFSGESEN